MVEKAFCGGGCDGRYDGDRGDGIDASHFRELDGFIGRRVLHYASALGEQVWYGRE